MQGLEKLSARLAIAGIEHVIVEARVQKKAIDYDTTKINNALRTYKKLSKNDLDTRITRTGGIVLVTRNNRTDFSPELKTAGDLDKYLKALIRTAKSADLNNEEGVEVDARNAPRRVTLHFKTSAERARERRKAKLYRQAHKSQLKLKAKKYRMKMKHRKPNKILSDRAKLVHKKHKY